MIDEPTRRRHDDVGAARQIAVLDRIRGSAVDADRVDLEAATVADGLLRNLLRPLFYNGKNVSEVL